LNKQLGAFPKINMTKVFAFGDSCDHLAGLVTPSQRWPIPATYEIGAQKSF
jgi:hypothetical protein